MPRLWYDRRSVNKIEDYDDRILYRNVVADKKPYFMKYIYPSLMRQYNTYIKSTNKNALRDFNMTIDEISNIPEDDRTESQSEFLKYYLIGMPVNTGDCVMNKICRKFEDTFDGYVSKRNSQIDFDYSIMKSDTEYAKKQYGEIKKIYTDYNRCLINYSIFTYYERVDEFESNNAFILMNNDFKRRCSEVCPDSSALCNIILDICYKRSATKRFAWSMCGHEIISNLLGENDFMLSYPVLNDDGDIEYCGNHFAIETTKIEVDE